MAEWHDKHRIALAKEMQKMREYDVIVVGAGTAGIPAAVAAAREGCQTLLLESQACLGGMLTNGCLAYVMDTVGKGGLVQEIRQILLNAGDARMETPTMGHYLYDVHAMETLLHTLCKDAQVETWPRVRILRAYSHQEQIVGLELERNGCIQRVNARLWIDASGTGCLACLVQCHYESGRGKDGVHQPCSVFAIVSGVPEESGFGFEWEQKMRLKDTLARLGCMPSYRAPFLVKLPQNDLWSLCVNHEYDVDIENPAALHLHYQHALTETNAALTALRSLPGWENLRLHRVSTQLGVRDGRRIEGMYRLTVQDVQAGRQFADGICTVHMPVDVHSIAGYDSANIRSMPYQIPYRSLVARDQSNLLLAGRLISGEFLAQASYRVAGNCMAMGEGAGVAAALRIKTPHASLDAIGTTLHQAMSLRGYAL